MSTSYRPSRAPALSPRSRRLRRAPPARFRASPGAAAGRRCRASSSGSSIRGDRPARAAAAAGLGARLGDQRQDDDARRWSRRSCGRASGSPTTARARTSSRASPPPSSAPRGRRARPVRGRRGGPVGGRAARPAEGAPARQPLPRPARPLRRARARRRPLARDAVADAAGRAARRQRRRPAGRATWRASTATDACLRPRRPDGTPGPLCSTRPTRSTACAAARPTTTPPPTSAISATTAARTAAMRVRRSTSSRATIELHGLDGISVHAARARRRCADRAAAARSLQRLQRARRGVARAQRSAARSTEVPTGSPASRPRSAASSGSRSATAGLMLLIKNPAGANEACARSSTPARPGSPSSPERRDRRRPRRLLDLGRRLRAAAQVSRPSSRPERAPPSSRCASPTAGSPATASRSCRSSSGARPWTRADAARRRADGAPDVHGDARAAADRRRPADTSRTTGRHAVRIRVGHLYPDYLNIYADRGNIAVLDARAGARGHELDVTAIGMRDPVPPGSTSSTWVAARIANRHSSRATSPRRRSRSGGRSRTTRLPRGLRRLSASRPLLPRLGGDACRVSGSCRSRRSQGRDA